MTKPFSVRELLARIRALLRRDHGIKKELDEYAFGHIVIDFRKQETTRKGKAVKLSVREYAVLKFLILHEGEVVTRDMLLNEVWGYEHFPTTRTVDNYILALRKKLEGENATPRHILTVHTAGYKFVKDGSSASSVPPMLHFACLPDRDLQDSRRDHAGPREEFS